uniref:NADH dehydrogenase subunit 2 n=1 Tax=Gelidium sclerophyllum TaxID=317102 RepID=A0A1D8X7I9_9FLOR|nr:NADH dehydrogenase subunit 2 [Gelidium sclerophyllum]AOX48998.1 NADH dehydrogenase subunit 2 [Gelidium sclerophyllum]
MSYILYDLYSILLEVYILLNIVILLIYGVFFSSITVSGFPILSTNLSRLSIQILLFSLCLVISQEFISLLSWNNFLVSDNFSYGAQLIVLLVIISWLFLIFFYSIQQRIVSFEFWILILLAVVSMLLIVKAYDLLSIYLTLELQALIFYILASFKRTSEFSTEAGLKYFVLGAFASALLLFGSSLIYGLTGMSNLNDFSKLFTGFFIDNSFISIGVKVGLVFIIVALLFKITASPFHMWAPDVYEGSMITITAFFSTIPKLTAFSILFRLLFSSFSDYIDWWSLIILPCIIASLIIGTLGAFTQLKWKRFMAYSSINHIGFLLFGLMAGTTLGIFSTLFYLLVYLITTIGTFGFIMSLKHYKYPKVYQARYLNNLVMLSIANPVLASTILIFLFSMAGIPPLAGFFSKLFVLLIAIQNNSIGISVIAVIMSCIACFYYIRLIKSVYFDKKIYWPILFKVDKPTSLILGLSTTILIGLWLDLELLTSIATFMSTL